MGVNSRIVKSTASGAAVVPPTGVDTPPVPAVVLVDAAGNLLATTDNGDGTATLDSGATLSTAAGDVASGSSDSGNPVKIGAVAHTAEPTAVTDGQRVNLIADKVGKLVTVGSIRDLRGQQQTTITNSTAETTIITQDATYFLDCYGMIIANTSASNVTVTIRDWTASTVRMVFAVLAGNTTGFMLPESAAHKQGTANHNWTATVSASVDSVYITAFYVKNL